MLIVDNLMLIIPPAYPQLKNTLVHWCTWSWKYNMYIYVIYSQEKQFQILKT